MPDNARQSDAPLSGHVIIAGFGIVGRCVAERLSAAGVPYCVVELNPATVTRLNHVGQIRIIEGSGSTTTYEPISR